MRPVIAIDRTQMCDREKVCLAFAIAGAIRSYLRAVRPGEFRWPLVPTPAVTAALVAAVAFTIARNLAR